MNAEKHKEITAEEFQKVVAEFVQRVVGHCDALAHEFGVHHLMVDKWSTGAHIPDQPMRPMVIVFINRHRCVKWCNVPEGRMACSERFQDMLTGFLEQSPKHSELVARLFSTIPIVIRDWAVGDARVPLPMVESKLKNLIELIHDHRCVCGE
ncbi:MAG: hypothetical protein Q7R85_02970 [bacterium]|nr:hypothetical protein [bacterium]